MTAVERAEFQIGLNDAPFQRSMENARTQVERLGTATNTAGQKIGAAATSVSGLNSALGNTFGQTNAVIGAAGNLASTFAAAGPVGLAIAAATTGIGILISSHEKHVKEMEDSRRAAVMFSEAVRDEVRSQLEAAQTELDALTDSLRFFGKSSAEIRLEKAKEQVQQATATLANAREDEIRKLQEIDSLEAKIAEARKGGRPSALAYADSLEQRELPVLRERLRVIQETRDTAQDLLTTGQLTQGAAESYLSKDAAARAAAKTGRVSRSRASRDKGPKVTANGLLLEFAFADRDDELKRAEEAQKKALKAQEDAAREREKIQRDMLRNLDKADDEYRRAEDRRRKKALEEEKKALEERMRYAEQQTLMFANAASSTVESVGMMLIKGQENVLGAVLDLVAQQVGGIIVGYGMEVMAGAVPKFFNPATIPVGIAQAAAGSALIGAGVGVRLAGAAALESGAVGSFIPNISAPGLNAGANGGADVTPISSGGVGRSSSAPSGSGGGLTIVVNNGIGMSSEDTQRAVVAAYREGQRRGFR